MNVRPCTLPNWSDLWLLFQYFHPDIWTQLRKAFCS